MQSEESLLALDLTREEINRLPLGRYSGSITLVQDSSQLAQSSERLRKGKVWGFDIESRPTFRKGQYYPPALVQLAGEHEVFLFQLGLIGVPQLLLDLFSEPSVVKVGVGLLQDIQALLKLADFEPMGFLDLSEHASRIGFRRPSLRSLTAAYLGFRISKSFRCSNWAALELSRKQLLYAATDAWVSHQIYRNMLLSKKVGGAFQPFVSIAKTES